MAERARCVKAVSFPEARAITGAAIRRTSLVPQSFHELVEQGVDLLINLSASPFEISKPVRRLNILRPHSLTHAKPLLFVNRVGGNDDLVFDGHSLVLNASGEIVTQLPGFASDMRLIDTENLGVPISQQDASREDLLLDALTLGLGDYMRKCGFTGCVLGLSGGIDSALAACIAARAVGPENVHALLMPSRYSSDHSVDDARRLAENLGIDWEIVPIDAVHQAYEGTTIIGDDLRLQPAGLADQNLQAAAQRATLTLPYILDLLDQMRGVQRA